MKEIWKDVPGYEGYYMVSNLGRVLSLNYRETAYPKIRSTPVDAAGYKALNMSVNGNRKRQKVHVLVAMAFLGHKPCGLKAVVDHIDENKLNNNISNLRVVSNRRNISKSVKSSSGLTGVSAFRNKWQSQIKIGKMVIPLGLYECKFEAARAYRLKLAEINASQKD